MDDLLFGYGHVDPDDMGGLCACHDPGNYVLFERRGDDPLDFTIVCWCGRRREGQFENLEEREALVAKYVRRA